MEGSGEERKTRLEVREQLKTMTVNQQDTGVQEVGAENVVGSGQTFVVYLESKHLLLVDYYGLWI